MRSFRAEGTVREDATRRRLFGEPDAVMTREVEGVDVSASWFDSPEFGEWGGFFHSEGEF